MMETEQETAERMVRIRAEIIEDLAGFILPAGDAEKLAEAIMDGQIRNVRVIY